MTSPSPRNGDRSTPARPGMVLVTGCSSGLGQFTANFLRSRGWPVIATARTEEHVAKLRNDDFDAVLLDLNSSASVESASQRILDLGQGALYGVVHNAGIEILGALEDLKRDDLRSCFETNVFGAMELTARLLPTLRAQNRGRIVFVSSSNSNGFGYPFMGPGNASKCALECLATTLKRELAATNVTVSTVCPGELPTNILPNMIARSAHILSSPSSRHREAYTLLEGRFAASPDEPKRGDLLAVATAIARMLESKAPARRAVVPLTAAIHYLAHFVLPERLQDALLFRRMRKVFGVHV